MCMCVFMHVFTCIHVHTWGRQRSDSVVGPYEPSAIFFETGSLIRSLGSPVRIGWSSSKTWDPSVLITSVYHHGAPTQVFMLAWQALYKTNK